MKQISKYIEKISKPALIILLSSIFAPIILYALAIVFLHSNQENLARFAPEIAEVAMGIFVAGFIASFLTDIAIKDKQQ